MRMRSSPRRQHSNHMLRQSSDAIARLIAPFGMAAFMNGYWERLPLYISRPMPDWAGELPGMADMDALIRLSKAGDIRLVRTRKTASTEREIDCDKDGRPDLFSAYRAYDEGWTIVVNGVHGKFEEVGRLVAELEDSISHKTGVNVYFTPPNSQGFAPHADGHDVFILQTTGRKHWRVFGSPVPLPLEEQAIPVQRKRLGPCIIDAILEPGHLLYIPRGFIHSGVAVRTASIHLTIGIHAFRWMNLVNEVVALVAERDVALRQSVRLSDLDALPRIAEVRRRLKAVHLALAKPRVIQEACLRLRRRRSRLAPPALAGHFAAIDNARSIRLGTMVRQRLGINGVVRIEKERAVLEFGGNRIEGPVACAPAMRFVLANQRFAVADLPGHLTNSSKLVLVQTMVTEGFLAVVT